MSTPAVAALETDDVSFVLHEYQVSEVVGDGYGEAVAAAIGAPPERVFKTLMADPGDAERLTGYVTGGISPLGQRKKHGTFVDESAMAFPTIFVSAGKRGLQMELAPTDLLRVTGGVAAPLL